MNALRAIRIAAWALVVIIVVAAGGMAISWYGGGAVRSGAVTVGGPFTLMDQTGAPITEKALQGKPSLVFFGFTYCPEVCPTTLSDMTVWMKKLGPDAEKLRAYFITVDPERDQPKQMADYLSAFDPRITGITGKPDDVFAMLKAYRVYYRKVQTGSDYTMDHPGSVYLFDRNGAFTGSIDYREKEDVVLAKLKKLAAS